MSATTVRLTDEKHARLQALAKARKVSINKLFDEMATVMLAEFDAETRYRLRAAKGSAQRGLDLLDKLDQQT